jgi:hypothetical protein
MYLILLKNGRGAVLSHKDVIVETAGFPARLQGAIKRPLAVYSSVFPLRHINMWF